MTRLATSTVSFAPGLPVVPAAQAVRLKNNGAVCPQATIPANPHMDEE